MNAKNHYGTPRVPSDRLSRNRADATAKAARRLREIWDAETKRVFCPAFDHSLVAHRAIAVVTGMLFSAVSGTLTDSIRARGKDQVDPTADFRALSRIGSVDTLFKEVFRQAIPFLPKEGPIIVAIDDTVLPKRGKKLAYSRWCHNPLVPPWQHSALMMGHPVFHAAVIVPDRVTMKPLAVTIAFEPVEPLPKELRKKRYPRKKRGSKTAKDRKGSPAPKRAAAKPKTKGNQGKRRGRPTKAEAAKRKEEERILRKSYPTAPDKAAEAIERIRGWMDDEGMRDRDLIVVGDGSYTNATVFFNLPERCVYVGRVRPDATLETIGKPKPGGDHTYGPVAPKPKEMATDRTIRAHRASFNYGGDNRILRYKVVGPLTRRNSTDKKRHRLLLLRPTAYKVGKATMYSHEAFLLTSDHTHPAWELIQAYLWRWSIECNHRNSKTYAKIGKAQCRIVRTVTKVHPAMAAGFSLLWLCVMKMNGGTVRTEIFQPMSYWQRANLASRNKKRVAKGKAEITPRASAADVLTLFRMALFGYWEDGLPRIAS